MKSVYTLFALLAFTIGINSNAAPLSVVAQQISVQAIRADFDNLINWKVGEAQNYDIELVFGKGTMVKTVAKEEGNAIWVKSTTNLMGQKDVSELLMSRTDGKILKFLHNGKEEQLPDSQIEIEDQDTQEITVPAGTFKTVHITAKMNEQKIELWANPKETCMDGGIQMKLESQFGDIFLKLTSFKKL